jgi:hypothetical protein
MRRPLGASNSQLPHPSGARPGNISTISSTKECFMEASAIGLGAGAGLSLGIIATIILKLLKIITFFIG